MQAKKSLGQNFLKSKSAIGDIIKAADLNADDIILEVGPGKGVLTEGLLQIAKRVVVVEKDDRMIPFLKEKFEIDFIHKKLEIVHGDILEFDPSKYGLEKNNFKIVANIPYYITGQFLRQFLESDCQPERMVLMLQKEVAKRIAASDKKESILSISVKAYGVPKYITTVPARYFSPAPKVDSAVLQISNISKKFFIENDISEKNFFEIVKAGFHHKRKMLIGNLKTVFPHRDWEDIFQKNNLPPKVRAEDISLNDWKKFFKQ